ncbi:MAG: hypothetical protein N4A47_04105 [Clostridia bacterium]|jgi:hypothetical protein|nr:hypothetical protein [Clostridia bacterium]
MKELNEIDFVELIDDLAGENIDHMGSCATVEVKVINENDIPITTKYDVVNSFVRMKTISYASKDDNIFCKEIVEASGNYTFNVNFTDIYEEFELKNKLMHLPEKVRESFMLKKKAFALGIKSSVLSGEKMSERYVAEKFYDLRKEEKDLVESESQIAIE